LSGSSSANNYQPQQITSKFKKFPVSMIVHVLSNDLANTTLVAAM